MQSIFFRLVVLLLLVVGMLSACDGRATTSEQTDSAVSSDVSVTDVVDAASLDVVDAIADADTAQSDVPSHDVVATRDSPLDAHGDGRCALADGGCPCVDDRCPDELRMFCQHESSGDVGSCLPRPSWATGTVTFREEAPRPIRELNPSSAYLSADDAGLRRFYFSFGGVPYIITLRVPADRLGVGTHELTGAEADRAMQFRTYGAPELGGAYVIAERALTFRVTRSRIERFGGIDGHVSATFANETRTVDIDFELHATFLSPID